MRLIIQACLICTIAAPALAADEAARHKATDFATRAATANMFELKAAEIEVAKGAAEDAKQFATDMLKDHGRAGPTLADAARKDGVELPSALDDEHQKKLDALQQSNRENFDQAYLSTQVTAHEEAVALFTDYSQNGPDGALKRASQKILPDLRMHLTRIQGLTSK
ncbi:DUF4142 domain-containing protein [Rhizobium hidalgonense]|uniref:DUF4142 domain-containing protein n=1 Tax=Rhizobium hidalgonense TaxID=1538159 RepID=A0A2A6K9A0_9HYPH|nr:DUF4142 domain-containing protein [Rhizobium hidalgonense]MDR9775973.1 DUF4142 domain-containing protein [Rhizobium hidalgonense]MDR9815090.1 DUF4142 domain-containing protein [Rhizobium hidalgonense]MDR9820782.1 DUF4142 domain-containing protein [Rhizobium hidalgonense]PDT20992.1 hypothetical protein CO674_25240 [Rhizobium hidalgonense]PON07224.1 hypothetical protein ATY29_12915 [Rhizobium hidalgonense]